MCGGRRYSIIEVVLMPFFTHSLSCFVSRWQFSCAFAYSFLNLTEAISMLSLSNRTEKKLPNSSLALYFRQHLSHDKEKSKGFKHKKRDGCMKLAALRRYEKEHSKLMPRSLQQMCVLNVHRFLNSKRSIILSC